MGKIEEIRLGFETAYINDSVVSSDLYRPQFVSNNYKEGKKVLSSLEDELLLCDGFQIIQNKKRYFRLKVINYGLIICRLVLLLI